jgi:hypothetical protein
MCMLCLGEESGVSHSRERGRSEFIQKFYLEQTSNVEP